MNKFSKSMALALFALVFSVNGNAALVSQSFTGQFLFVDGSGLIDTIPSLSSISLVAPVSGSVTYDDVLVAEVDESFLALEALTLTFGDLMFDETDDLDYGLGPYPDADFLDGNLVGVGFFTDMVDAFGDPIWELDVFGNQFEFIDFNTGTVLASGIMDYTVVPVPAAVWLFLSGIVGIFGIARRRS